jgi:hypothetical protein
MMNTLAAMHAAARARKKQAAGAKAATVDVRKRRRPSAAPKEPCAPPSQPGENAHD